MIMESDKMVAKIFNMSARSPLKFEKYDSSSECPLFTSTSAALREWTAGEWARRAGVQEAEMG